MKNKNIILKVLEIIILIFFFLTVQARAENQPFSRGEALFGAGKYDEAFPIISEYGLQGLPRAQGLLARMHGNGWGTPVNSEKAYEYALKAAAGDDPSGLYVLGFMYENGRFVDKNLDTSIKWYEKAAKMGNDRGDQALARIYDSELDVHNRDIKNAFKWLQSAANKGHAYSQRRLAIYYLYILDDNKKDFNEAVRWFLSAIENGDVYSNTALGNAYSLGLKKIPPDYFSALKYYEAAFNFSKSHENINRLDIAFSQLLPDYYIFGNKKYSDDFIIRCEKFYEYLKEINHPRWYSYQATLHSLGIERPVNSQLALGFILKYIKSEFDFPSRFNSEVADDSNKFNILKNLHNVSAYFKDLRYPNRIFEEPRLSFAWWNYSSRYSSGFIVVDPEIIDAESYTKSLEEYTTQLKINLNELEINKYSNISINELIYETQNFLNNRSSNIGPIEPSDLVNEGALYFNGEKGRQINEPFAQYLIEQGLRIAIKNRDKLIEASALSNLGEIASSSLNSSLKDERLSISLILEGYSSNYSPPILLWLSYENKVKLTDDQLLNLQARYKKAFLLPHPSTYIKKLDFTVTSDVNKYFLALGHFVNDEKNNSRKILIKKRQCSFGASNLEIISPNLVMTCYRDLLILVEAEKVNADYEQEHLDPLYSYMLVDEVNIDLNKIRKFISGNYEKGAPNVIDIFNNLYGFTTKSIGDGSLDFSTSTNIPIVSGKVSALIIGNGKYESKPLKNSPNDAKLFANKLRNLGFNVFSYSNLSKKQFRKVLFDFYSSSKNSELTLFFFSGHGMQIGGVI